MSLIQKVPLHLRLACCLVAAGLLAGSLAPHMVREPSAWADKHAGQYTTEAAAQRSGKSTVRLSALQALLARMSTEPGAYAGGLYVPDEFAFPIVAQPEDQDLYVSTKRNLLTLFRAAQQNGVTGLLAHNFLAGALFYDLEIGQEVWVVESEQKQRAYKITRIEQFQKITGAQDEVFIDLRTNDAMSTSEVFDRFYTGEPHLTLQTCLEGEGDPSWGLTFIVAVPLD